jgi:hypothetical protein
MTQDKLKELIEICYKAGSAGIPLKELLGSFENTRQSK